jgi:broad specificity phosphatase PhoE
MISARFTRIAAAARRLILSSLALLICSCAGVDKNVHRPEAAQRVVVVVRHAEKLLSTDVDPPLSAEGVRRAEALAKLMARRPLVAVYSTAFQRTQATATPSAEQFDLPVTTYDAKQSADAFVTELTTQHTTGTVLVVGHSNTVPLIVSALCQCAAPALTDKDYGDRFEIEFSADGSSVLRRASF